MEWVQLIIGFVTTLIVNGSFFYTINRKLKNAEVKDKETEILKKQDDEWQELYQEQRNRIAPLEAKLDEVYKEKGELNRALLLKDVEIERLKGDFKAFETKMHWYKCTVNNCPNRRPPHVFDKDGNELEATENEK